MVLRPQERLKLRRQARRSLEVNNVETEEDLSTAATLLWTEDR